MRQTNSPSLGERINTMKQTNYCDNIFYPYWCPLNVEDPARILSWMKVIRLAAEKISSDKTAEL